MVYVEHTCNCHASLACFQKDAEGLCALTEKGFKQMLGLKKQGSKSLAPANSNPNPKSNPANPYPMASGGHHAGRLGSHDQQHTPAQSSQRSSSNDPAQPGSVDYPDEQAAVAAAVAASELAAQESGRLSEHRSGGHEQQEQAMLELAIKVQTASVTHTLYQFRLEHLRAFVAHSRMWRVASAQPLVVTSPINV